MTDFTSLQPLFITTRELSEDFGPPISTSASLPQLRGISTALGRDEGRQQFSGSGARAGTASGAGRSIAGKLKLAAEESAGARKREALGGR